MRTYLLISRPATGLDLLPTAAARAEFRLPALRMQPSFVAGPGYRECGNMTAEPAAARLALTIPERDTAALSASGLTAKSGVMPDRQGAAEQSGYRVTAPAGAECRPARGRRRMTGPVELRALLLLREECAFSPSNCLGLEG